MIQKINTIAIIAITAMISCSDSKTETKYVPPADSVLPSSVNSNPQTVNPETQVNPLVTPTPGTVNLNPANAVVPGTNTVQFNPGQTNPAIVPTISQQPVATNTAPGMNPPHGEPGHRCDINVGAPLNSKPNATPAPVTANMSTPVVQPPVMTTQPVAQKTAPGMNPPHGEPGHRCDITVGAPLNSAPAVKDSSKH